MFLFHEITTGVRRASLLETDICPNPLPSPPRCLTPGGGGGESQIQWGFGFKISSWFFIDFEKSLLSFFVCFSAPKPHRCALHLFFFLFFFSFSFFLLFFFFNWATQIGHHGGERWNHSIAFWNNETSPAHPGVSIMAAPLTIAAEIRKLRKKLRQIENLERLARPLDDLEKLKVGSSIICT